MEDGNPHVRFAKQIAVDVYTGEPCRICGKLLTYDDMLDGAVHAGYSKDNVARAAHRGCWEAFGNAPKAQWWVYGEDAVE